MYTTLVLSGLLAIAMGAPLVARQNATEWQAAEGTSATCDAASDKYISLAVGPEQSDVIFKHACAGILPVCAYPPEDMICTQTINYKIDGLKNKTLNALVERKDNHNKLSDWAVNFAVTPAEQPEGTPGVFLTKTECEGYFQELLLKSDPEGCNVQGLGPSAGTLTVGGTSSLKDTVFSVSFVRRA
ncbi:hypothetical protein BU23DRAFT_157589 [Bimuria novae-zelandiae CBS 107.79]|uniref:Ecp2 effector protein domain-containing protein n=1 Tax=Bimuria novae-zelandiae CBS 107.79 TaxID=1447943 RepID=A0A6A5VCL5_9PLEO|nr:hypothetical protein BU23DRAFT_157589 [Bimuria novae-zelandiae CBS 107.79]